MWCRGLGVRLFDCDCLGQADSAGGASVSASAAFGALVGVDAVDITFGDSANGAFIDAGATCYTVFANYVSHSCFSLEFRV